MEKYTVCALRTLAENFIEDVKSRGGHDMNDNEVFFDTETLNHMNEREDSRTFNICGTRYHFHYDYHAFELGDWVIDVLTCFPKEGDNIIVCPKDLVCPVLYQEDKPYEVCMTRTPMAFTIRIRAKANDYTAESMSICYEKFRRAYENVYLELDKIAPIY